MNTTTINLIETEEINTTIESHIGLNYEEYCEMDTQQLLDRIEINLFKTKLLMIENESATSRLNVMNVLNKINANLRMN